MQESGEKTKYCFDSSAFINSWRIYHPPIVFPTLWEGISELIDSGRIILPREAEKEIKSGSDELSIWFKKNKKCVVPYTDDQIKIVTEILTKYPKVSQYNKVKPIHADPFLVALAKIENATVVTWESRNGSSENPSIPTLCYEMDIECINMAQFLEMEGWQFRH